MTNKLLQICQRKVSVRRNDMLEIMEITQYLKLKWAMKDRKTGGLHLLEALSEQRVYFIIN